VPYCPSCRAEYRAGIPNCVTCEGSIALVAELPEIVRLTPRDETKAVGIAPDDSRQVKVGDRVVDLARAFALDEASELSRALENAGIPALLREIEDIVFPGGQTRFEVHVRAQDHARAEGVLRARWEEMVAAEGGAVAAVAADRCPACGAEVPMSAEECPDCGLYVGIGEDDEDDDDLDDDDDDDDDDRDGDDEEE
jgi:hypothetical protein